MMFSTLNKIFIKIKDYNKRKSIEVLLSKRIKTLTPKKVEELTLFLKEVIILTPTQLKEIDSYLKKQSNYDTQHSRVLRYLKEKYPYMSAREELTRLMW